MEDVEEVEPKKPESDVEEVWEDPPPSLYVVEWLVPEVSVELYESVSELPTESEYDRPMDRLSLVCMLLLIFCAGDSSV